MKLRGQAPTPQFRPFLCCHEEAGGEYTELPMRLFPQPSGNRTQQSKFGAGQDAIPRLKG